MARADEGWAHDVSSATYRALLGATLILGGVLRVVHLSRMRATPFFDALILDARAYDAWAQRIAGGELIGGSAFWIDPLYAYVLGALYALLGHDLMAPRVLNAALGLATAWLVADTARRVLDSRIAALAACALVSLFVPAIHFESQIEKTALTVFLLSACVHLFTIGTLRALIAAGVVLGLATLARGNMLLFLPVGALALFRGWDREPGDALIATASLRRMRALVFAACALPIVGLATAHNALATGELIPTTTNFGINLYIGNHAGNEHGAYQPPDFVQPSTDTEQPNFRSEAERRSGESFSDRELSSYWASEALRAIAADPIAALRLTLRKLWSLLSNEEIPDSEAVELFAHWSKVVGAPIVWFGQLIPLAVLGAAMCLRRRGVRVLTAIAALYVLSLLPFFVLARLRMPLLPPLAVLGGGAIAWLADAIDQRRARELAQAAALVRVVALGCMYQPQWMARRTSGGLAIGWHNLGAGLEKSGRTSEAIRAFERAVEVDARAVPGSLRALGAHYQSQGDYARAEQAMRRVVELRPESASARAAWRGLFSALLRGGDSERGIGIGMLQDAVQRGPYDENLRYFLGQTMERQASAEAMVALFSAAVARDPKPQTSHYFWAIGLLRLGDTKGALAQLERALVIDPAHEMSQHRIGLVLEQQGDLAGALARYEEAARIHPDYKDALSSAARIAEQLGRADLANDYRRRAASANPSSPRRYLHWARYLLEHGRNEAALAELERMLEEQPGDAEGTRLRDRILQGANGEQASGPGDDRLEQLRVTLTSSGTSALIKIVYDERYASAQALATRLSQAFSASSWNARLERAPFGLKPGIVALAANHPATPAADVAINALRAVPMPLELRTGYREYADEMKKTNPDWRGLTLAPDEDLLIVIGDY